MPSNLKNMNILISGASIAGPALAFWLERFGCTVTVVERAPGLKMGGYKIDVRGKAVGVIKAMGLYEKIKAFDVAMETAKFVDHEGKITMEMPADFLGMRGAEDIELMRADLSSVLFEATRNSCEYIFGDSIKSLIQSAQSVTVTFEHGPSRDFDFVIGADGIHSKVRNLIFGAEENFSYNLGDHYFAIFAHPNFLGLHKQELFFSDVGKMVNIYGTDQSVDARALFVFHKPDWQFDYRNIDEQKSVVLDVFSDLSWEIPKLLEEMKHSTDFYFDVIQQIRMDHWSQGRVAVVGDAAYAPALSSGQGASMALVGAYVLAHELNQHSKQSEHAFLAYEKMLRPFVLANQLLGVTIMKSMVPKKGTWLSKLRAKIMGALPFGSMKIDRLRKQSFHAANCIDLKSYEYSNPSK